MRGSAWIALVLAGSLTGQLKTVVTPPHAANLEGDSSSSHAFTNKTTRTQQVDGNLAGNRLTIVLSMALRRSNSHNRSGSGPRRSAITIDLGYGADTHGTNFDKNFKDGTRWTAFKRKTVSLPDWRGAASRPAAFDLVLKLDTPFVYNRVDSVVWDMTVEQNTGGGNYWMDLLTTAPTITNGTTPVAFGKGCTTNNGDFKLLTSYNATSSQLLVGLAVSGAESRAPITLLLGTDELNLDLGFCGNLRAAPALAIPVGTSDVGGKMSRAVTALWQRGMANAEVITQAAHFDGKTMRLSTGSRASTPSVRGGGGAKALLVQRLTTVTGKGPTGTRSLAAVPVAFRGL